MCLHYLKGKSWVTFCGEINGTKIHDFLKRIWIIIKAIISRCVFAVYCFVAVWRVTQALQNDAYWFLLLTLLPLALETLHAFKSRTTNQLKWITPNVLFYLVCAIPCIWLLELKLLNDRLNENDPAFSGIPNSNSTLSQTINSVIGINASDEEWTLALEQILIFALVLAKWIAPKGGMSLDELSQLLLVNIAAGADIIELMETFNEEQVQQNREIVYMIMAVWSWSLLQFTIVLTAAKEFPQLDGNTEAITVEGDRVKSRPTSNGNINASSPHNESAKTSGEAKRTIALPSNGVDPCPSTGSCVVEMNVESPLSNAQDLGEMHDELRATEEVDAFLEGRRCFDWFCCYNEIWGMTMSIIFQDGPFFIVRMVILFHYNVITHMNIFFTGKNIFVIILLLNRIRAVYTAQKKPWLDHMDMVKKQRRNKKDQIRIEKGLPPKTKPNPPIKKSKWLIWRA